MQVAIEREKVGSSEPSPKMDEEVAADISSNESSDNLGDSGGISEGASNPTKDVFIFIFIAVVFYLIGVSYYANSDVQWTVHETVYFITISITAVGYGDYGKLAYLTKTSIRDSDRFTCRVVLSNTAHKQPSIMIKQCPEMTTRNGSRFRTFYSVSYF